MAFLVIYSLYLLELENENVITLVVIKIIEIIFTPF